MDRKGEKKGRGKKISVRLLKYSMRPKRDAEN
jgi:hypothetical protein